MKKRLIMMAVGVGLSSFAFTQDVPANVMSTFKSKFPTATEVHWDKENETEWEAEFEFNGMDYTANFSSDGIWKETEHELTANELPATVKQTLTTEFSGYTIKEVEMVETPTFTGYEVEIKKGSVTLEVLIDNSGKVIKKKVESKVD